MLDIPNRIREANVAKAKKMAMQEEKRRAKKKTKEELIKEIENKAEENKE